METAALEKILTSIDASLQVLANAKGGGKATAFVTKKVVAQKLSLPGVRVDVLIHLGLTSGGTQGLVEGRHYTRVSDMDDNPSLWLYDLNQCLADAWLHFKNYDKN